MTFPDFEKLTPQEQLSVIDKADPMECPFWMERLKTALDERAPQVIVLFKLRGEQDRINDIYWNLIQIKND